MMRLSVFVGLVVVVRCIVDEPPKPGVDDWFGVDVEAPGPDGNDKRSVRIKAFPGNNLTALAIQFFDGHSPSYNSSDLDFVVNHLEEAGGGKCDSCKTLVELMSLRFIEMGRVLTLNHSPKRRTLTVIFVFRPEVR